MLLFGDARVAVLGQLIELALNHPQRDVAEHAYQVEGVVHQRDTLDLVRVLCDVTLRRSRASSIMTKNGDANITEDEHLEMVRRKTAYLFGGCARTAVCSEGVAGAEEKPSATTGSIWVLPSRIIDNLSFSRVMPRRWASRSAPTCVKAR